MWHLGNTTVRTPYRLRDGLVVLANSSLAGNLVGRTQESEFARQLHAAGVVFVDRIAADEDADYSDMGRKWRSALAQLGFITPKLSPVPRLVGGIDPLLVDAVAEFSDLNGRPYEISANGRRLIGADSVAQQQECFLRALLAYQLPSPIERDYDGPIFSPLRLVLQVFARLEEQGSDPVISREEMASIVQFVKSDQQVAEATATIRRYRLERADAENVRTFDRAFRAAQTGRESTGLATLSDYQDVNFRYLKATGLFTSRGRSIAVAPDQKRVVRQILGTSTTPLEIAAYLVQLWAGAELPTDRSAEAIEVINDLADLIRGRGRDIELPPLAAMPPADLAQTRLGLEDQWQRLQEEEYADRQRYEWQEIVGYMRTLAGLSGGPVVPSAERPAYLEWAVWRAFLAVDSLTIAPWQCRRFRIDQDFLPVAPAPGSGPDMMFEFADFVVVVEVTLTSSSRQEAAEGEPVRRHVARVVEEYENRGKPVYGLFIANTIDSNTAETFRIGAWYKPDDGRLALRIVPLTLADFSSLIEAGFAFGGLEPRAIEQLIKDCRVSSNEEAPQWKREIAWQVARHIGLAERARG